MSRCTFRLLVLTVLLLWPMPGYAGADEEVFGIPEATAVEYDPDRHIDPITLLPIEVNGRWGYADRRGDIVVEPRYEWVDYPYRSVRSRGSERTWIARYVYEGKLNWMVFYGRERSSSDLLKANNFEVFRGGGSTADRYARNYAVVGRGSDNDRKYFMRISNGDRLTEVIYTGMLRVADGYSAVEVDGRCGFIDTRGKVVIPMQYAEVRSFRDGMAAVRLPQSRGGAWGFIGKSGRFRFRDKTGEIQELRSYHGGLAAVKVRGKWGFLDKAQNGRVEPIYDEVRDFAGGSAAVRRGTEWGYIDITGKEFAWGYQGAWSFEDETRTGINSRSKTIQAVKLGLIRQDGGYGYINRTGRVMLEPRYENALPFYRELARVKCGDSFAYIDKGGRVIWDPRRVSLYGIRGLNVATAVEPQWPGLPQPDGSSGEPYPFEYDVDDLLPFKRQGSNETPNQEKIESSRSSN